MERKQALVALMGLGLGALVPSRALATTVVRGPYLQQVTTDAALVVFDLDAGSAAEVRVGLAAVTERTVPSTSSGTHHEVMLTGLELDTEYRYAVEVPGGIEGYAEHRLRTAVAPGAPFTFLVAGDPRSGHDEHTQAVAAMQQEDARLLVLTGDLVADGEETDQWDTFFSIETPLLSEVPLYPVVGNHDEYQGDAANFRDAFALPGNELYYSFDHGSAHFVMLDGHASTEPVCVRDDDQILLECFDEAQLQWLAADLEAACERDEISWTFVVIHSGPYSSDPGRTGNGQMRDLLPLLERQGVTAIFSGHDHYYERGASSGDLAYVISGGAGAPLYELGAPCAFPHTVATNASVHHYLVVEVGAEAVHLTAKTLDQAILDETTLETTKPCRPPDPPLPAAAPATSAEDGCSCRLADRPRPSRSPWLALALLAAAAGRRRHASRRERDPGTASA